VSTHAFARIATYGAVVSTVLFLTLAVAVERGYTKSFDVEVLRTINQTATPFWNGLYVQLTELGSLVAIAAAVSVAVAWLVQGRRWADAVFMVAAVAGAGLINLGLKAYIERDRPALRDYLVHESSFSFPSGHAMGTSALVLAILFIARHSTRRYPLLMVGLLYVGFVSYSRLYLGVHYPSDIIGGWLASAAWVSVTWLCVTRIAGKYKDRTTQ
jgi:membrane-associated phospholipid phosphatase